MIYECSLPFPPSVNKAYGNRSNQKRFKSKAYKAWEQSCPELTLPEKGAIDWPVAVVYRFYLPDRRLRDVANYEKLVTDQLVKKCVLVDDNFKIIKSMHLHFSGVDRGNPRVDIEIYELKENVVSI
jgi:Holliday junction resolvase RusA-like endonuclease